MPRQPPVVAAAAAKAVHETLVAAVAAGTMRKLLRLPSPY